jgi:hypothetical protein
VVTHHAADVPMMESGAKGFSEGIGDIDNPGI